MNRVSQAYVAGGGWGKKTHIPGKMQPRPRGGRVRGREKEGERPSPAGLVPPNCLPLLAILWQPSCVHKGVVTFDHIGAAILCVEVMVNLHIILLLYWIEAWCMDRGQMFALKGVPDQGGGSLGAWGSLSKGPVVVCRPATPPSDPSGGPGIWDIFTFYN